MPYEHPCAVPRQIQFKVHIPRHNLNRFEKPSGYQITGLRDESSDIGLGDNFLSQTDPSTGVVVSKGSTSFIRIAVGRCDCDFGHRIGTLGVLITSMDVDGQDVHRQFTPEQHDVNHSIHVVSWPIIHGRPTKKFLFTSRANKEMFQLQLRLSIGSSDQYVRTFTLEITPIARHIL